MWDSVGAMEGLQEEAHGAFRRERQRAQLLTAQPLANELTRQRREADEEENNDCHEPFMYVMDHFPN